MARLIEGPLIPAAMLPQGDGEWVLVTPTAINVELGLVAVDVRWSTCLSEN
jgi:hypothetical protein